ncbi:MAG TPA: DNA-binding protein [Ruminococcaceae bacterium]|nr:DNA-binding protein [Oscillospiraceae bacterium]
MKRAVYKCYDDLPMMLSVPEVASALGISRAGAYDLVRSDGFPVIRIGKRVVIPKENLVEWIKKQVSKKEQP